MKLLYISRCDSLWQQCSRWKSVFYGRTWKDFPVLKNITNHSGSCRGGWHCGAFFEERLARNRQSVTFGLCLASSGFISLISSCTFDVETALLCSQGDGDFFQDKRRPRLRTADKGSACLFLIQLSSQILKVSSSKVFTLPSLRPIASYPINTFYLAVILWD